MIDMHDAKLQTLDRVRAFLKVTAEAAFSNAKERREFVARTAHHFDHAHLQHADKGVVPRFLEGRGLKCGAAGTLSGVFDIGSTRHTHDITQE
jgi:hypothetical protein